ncbi:MAG: hypothetical protein RJP95_02730 [Pirellulales bacterium]
MALPMIRRLDQVVACSKSCRPRFKRRKTSLQRRNRLTDRQLLTDIEQAEAVASAFVTSRSSYAKLGELPVLSANDVQSGIESVEPEGSLIETAVRR